MLQSIIKEYLQEMLESYINTDEKFERLFNGDKVDISSLELTTDSKKQSVKNLLGTPWMIFEVNDSGTVQSIQLCMDIFKSLNTFDYQKLSEVDSKLFLLTESYFREDVYKTCNEFAEIAQKELVGLDCEVTKIAHGSLRMLFTPNENFFIDPKHDMEVMVRFANTLNGYVKLIKNNDGVLQYVFAFMGSWKKLVHLHYVEKVKEQLSKELDLLNLDEDNMIQNYFKNRRAEQDKSINND